MIILFGSPGAGKSVQGQKLAQHHGWHWFSNSQVLRETKDKTIRDMMSQGQLVPDTTMNRVVGEAFGQIDDVDKLILDGFPRNVVQAQWLVDNAAAYQAAIEGVIVLEVSDKELYERLHSRGRDDDTPATIAKRSLDYRHKTQPVLDYLKEAGVNVYVVDGEGSIEVVQQRIDKAFEACLQG